MDVVQHRLDKAKTAANCETDLCDEDARKIVEQIREMTNGRDADLCVDAVGIQPERTIVDRTKAVINIEKSLCMSP